MPLAKIMKALPKPAAQGTLKTPVTVPPVMRGLAGVFMNASSNAGHYLKPTTRRKGD